ncbi:hypothetical protein ACLOJK_011982 [Asimina triloba]
MLWPNSMFEGAAADVRWNGLFGHDGFQPIWMTAADWNLWWMWRDAAGWMVKMEAAGSVIVGVAEGDLGRPLCTCCRFVMETMVVVEAVVAVVIWHRWRRRCYGRLLAGAGWMGAACGRVADRRWRWKEMRVLAVDGPDAGRKDGGSAAGDGRTLVRLAGAAGSR